MRREWEKTNEKREINRGKLDEREQEWKGSLLVPYRGEVNE